MRPTAEKEYVVLEATAATDIVGASISIFVLMGIPPVQLTVGLVPQLAGISNVPPPKR